VSLWGATLPLDGPTAVPPPLGGTFVQSFTPEGGLGVGWSNGSTTPPKEGL
jgi:hypothetical protein